MDRRTIEDWTIVVRATNEWQSRTPHRIKAMLLQLKEEINEAAINQLEHGLQTATRALRDGASEELVIAALCHDLGTAISVENHPAIAAEILKPFVSSDIYDIVLTHQDFQKRHYHPHFGKDSEARRRYINEAWYETACRFSDEWDQTSFDPSYCHFPLEYFEPLIDRIFKQPRPHSLTKRKAAVIRGGARIKRWLSRQVLRLKSF
jgi:predicted HD phosphohydrolase